MSNQTTPAADSLVNLLAPLEEYTQGWWVVFATVITTIPWAIVAVWDAIDSTYRSRRVVAGRLIISTFFLLIAYLAGMLFSISLTVQVLERKEGTDGRHDELAAVLVLLLFNIWHVSRNIRGWLQYAALMKLRPFFERVQHNFGESFQSCDSTDSSDLILKLKSQNDKIHIAGLSNVLISNRLVDNDFGAAAPYLNFFTRLGALEARPDVREHWAGALWRAWWTQETRVVGYGPRFNRDTPSLDTPAHFRCDRNQRYGNAQDLLQTEPSARLTQDGYHSLEGEVCYNHITGKVIQSKEEWAECLVSYGTPEGQQDTHGDRLDRLINVTEPSALAILISEKRTRIPNRMCALWYDTECFEEVYKRKARECSEWSDCGYTLFPSWPKWLEIAQDVAIHAERPVYLSDTQLTSFAGELASTSIILVRYPFKFRQLVRLIYDDGRNARWTFGWSGLLACFSHLWTEERIYMAMLNGLSLLALDSVEKVSSLDANVRSMLYGYAAFEVSDRAVGKRIAEDRKAELLKRYSMNKGKTCRGSGVWATRLACRALGLPAEASHMDGLPAFSTGWASEYMERLPGNQKPTHGTNHDEVEAMHGSSNALRYPYSRS